ncbi:L,D-transpeptidase [Bifidobacterium myosotis]|uniref:Murein L,D-transpeptidase n=1 Tax=Bifidobacterium myosotis TaxID=1630166 RepID=A0A5M9ZN04_9BIFI|nr:L,D-transpeptidase [Bifidobacterium myosotis]KAA8829037.1 murein L,D-transpeptidase [Bifidobacterium myosotis]
MTDVTTSFPRPNDEQTTVLRPVGFDGMPRTTADTDAVDTSKRRSRMTHAKRRNRTGLVVLFAVLAVLLAALIAYFFIGRWYFQDKAAPGVHLGNVSVMGQTKDELTDTVNQQVKNTVVSFTADGKTAKASLSDLGVSVDTSKTVDALLNAKTGDFAKLNIFDQPHVALVASTDNATAEQYVTDGLVDEADRVQLTSVSYNKDSQQFEVVAGKDGKQPNTQTITAAVKQTVANPGEHTTVAVKLETGKDVVDPAAAQQVSDDANARLGLTINLGNTKDRNITIPAEQIATFLKPTTNVKTGEISLKVDDKAISTYVASADVVKELTEEKVTREVYIAPKSEGGQRIGADKTLGQDGVEVTGVGDAPAQIAKALEQNQPVDTAVAVKDTPYDVKEVEVPHNFDVANGDPWVHVNLTNQTATAYRGTTPVATFNIASGQYTADGSRLSATGTFYVYLKYESQTMSGPGYSQPGTPWVSYYNGSEALHGVPVYMWGEHPIYVQQGIPGSHGCINMQVADAKWMYDFAPLGTRVVVDGTTPSSGEPLRAAGPDATTYTGA